MKDGGWKMDKEKIVGKLIKKMVEKNFKTLGIEKTLEVIESIKNPIYRARMRIWHLNYLKNQV